MEADELRAGKDLEETGTWEPGNASRNEREGLAGGISCGRGPTLI